MMAPWADDVLTCAPLRDAVYRNRTPDRGLRHAVSLGCLPFRSFAAVAPWLPPWDIVPPAEACAKVASLEINTRGKSQQRLSSMDLLVRAAEVLSRAAGERTAEGQATPFSNVKHLALLFSQTPGSHRLHGDTRFAHALRLLFQSLPQLQSLASDGFAPYWSTDAAAPWFTERDSLSFVSKTIGRPLTFSNAVAAFRNMPRLRSVTVRGCVYPLPDILSHSLLLCRATLKHLTYPYWNVVSALVPESETAAFRHRICHASETPPCSEPESIELTADRLVPASVVPRVPVHWTLETLVIDPCDSLPFSDLQRMILSCPRLRSVLFRRPSTLHQHPSQGFFSVALAGDDVVVSRGSAAIPTDTYPGDFVTVRQDVLQQEQLDAMHVAHRYVQAVVAAYVADRSLLPEALSRHRAGLDAVVDGGAYPAALLWAFARGPEHTTLQSVKLVGLLALSDAAAVEAVVALAARQRRTERRSQYQHGRQAVRPEQQK